MRQDLLENTCRPRSLDTLGYPCYLHHTYLLIRSFLLSYLGRSGTLMTMVVTVVNRKGGAAKSTIAIHLAAALESLGPTVLVDLDDENATALEYAEKGHLPYVVTDGAGWNSTHRREPWDHVVVDGYARPSGQQLDALATAADLILIPTPPDAVSLRVLARFLPTVGATGVPYRVLVTMKPPFPSREGEKAHRDLQKGGVPTFETTVPRMAAFGRAARSGVLAWEMPRANRLVFLFDGLAKEVLQHGAKPR